MTSRALLPLIVLGACGAPAPDGAISITWQAWGDTMLRVEPSPRVIATGPAADIATTPAGIADLPICSNPRAAMRTATCHA